MLRGVGWFSVVASLCIASVACVSTEPGDGEEGAQAIVNGKGGKGHGGKGHGGKGHGGWGHGGKDHDGKGHDGKGCNGGGGEAKVTICHIPPGNPDNAHTIEVGAAALGAHLAHGDTLGECGDEGEGEGEGGEGGSTGSGSGPVCSVDGVPCDADIDCCSNLCGGSGICVSQCTLGPELGGSSCSADNDCCAGSCIEGSCYEGWSCNLPGAPCNPDSESAEFWCCFGLSCGADGACH